MNLRLLAVRPRDIQSTFRAFTSTFCVLRNILEIFHAAARPSVSLCQLSVHLRNLPSTFCASVELLSNSVSVLCVRGVFKKVPYSCWILCQHHSTFCAVAGLSGSLLCIRGTFRQPLSTFHVSKGQFVNFPCVCRAFRELPSTFCASTGPTVNFPCVCGTFCQLPLTLCASSGPSVNICASVGPSKNVSYCRWNFCQL